VDREERPDIDQVYMTALTSMDNGRGGWPLSMFLLPDGRPIYGGTYWPRDDWKRRDEKGREETYHGFKSVLRIVQEGYQKEPKGLEKQAEALARATARNLEGALRGLALVELNRDLVTAAVDQLKDRYDSLHGGFGSPERKFRGPKFPSPPNLELVLQQA